jgi:hypothetical protein
MRARQWIHACRLILTTSTLIGLATAFSAHVAAQEDELPPLELLGFIADFSDEEEGWVDPQEIEGIFTLGNEREDLEGMNLEAPEENDESRE